jgi:RNA polymerase sigma-70 factor, ECF subfamily
VSQPEPQLISACLAGDADSIVRLVEQFQDRVFRLAWRMLGDRHEAEDVTQETFTRALRSLARWDSSRRFEPWLLAIAANRCRTVLSRRRLPTVNCPEAAADVAGAPDTRFENRQLVEEIELALDDLRHEYAEAFRLFHVQHLAYADIAEQLEVPLGTVKTWVHRARREIATRLKSRGVVEAYDNEHLSPELRNRDALRSDRVEVERVAG